MKARALLAAYFVLCGCGSNNMVRPGVSQQEFAADRYACVQESRTPYSAGGTGYAGLGLIIGSAIGASAQAQSLYELCMAARGYSKIDPAMAAATSPAFAPTPPPQAYGPPPGYVLVSDTPQAPAFDPGPVAAPQPRGISGESKYLMSAERLAKTHGCVPPATTMTAKGMGLESFAVNCPNGKTYAINCEAAACVIVR